MPYKDVEKRRENDRRKHGNKKKHFHKFYIDNTLNEKVCRCGMKDRDRIIRCKTCKKDFKIAGNTKYCSAECYAKDKRTWARTQKKIKKKCKNCKKVFTYPACFPLRTYCGIKCATIVRAKMRMKKRDSVSQWKKRTWVVFSKYIRNRDDWVCFTCGIRIEGRQMHAGHFISRSHNNTLFDEMNVHAQCAGCNMFKNGQPHIYAEKLIKIHGQKAFFALVDRGKITKTFTKQELNEIYDHYKKLNSC